MKKYALIILLGLAFTITSCLDDDGYSLGKVWIGFGMIEQTSSDPVEYKINMDNGDVLIPVASGYSLPWYYYGSDDPNSRLKTGERVLLNYTILDDNANDGSDADRFYIKVNSVKKVLLKGIMDITEENQDSIGNDPIIVKHAWMTDSLLNFEIKYWGRYEVHYINLVKEPGELDGSQAIELELRHNDNGDREDLPFAAYVSFNLNQLKIAGQDSVKVRVTSTDYDGEVNEYKGVFKYEEDN
ncbi:NigD-like protein [Mariniphaga anaerophila]|uniref:NigD-like protein n=1 Tax=Mariniphaga anaerophila TaxID=1484053 RepID=A0A1M5DFW8_9BACT|nr:NigD-like C-terminal domain-containing protein [Mariniphaga anaerophila]SHF65889.1 NigD-like protein [Mariniphaga anaerophila]